MSDHLNYSKSRWNGWNGNECVYKKDYHKAIEYYNTAIELYPLEYRYFVNRSFCFDQLQRFELALEDAQRALLLQSDWGKCYYRKARALKGLKRLDEAEFCFRKVIQLEGNDCKEAQHELRTLRDSILATPAINIGLDSNGVINETKSEPKSKDQENNKIKKSNRNSSNKLLFSKSDSNETENVTNEDKSMNATTPSENKNKKLILSLRFGEKNLLKELSDFLVNRKVLPSNESTKSLQIIDLNKKCEQNEQKSIIGHKSVKDKLIDKDFKIKSNRRNVRKGMDEIVEIWDDSRNHWSPTSNRTQIVGSSKPRKAEPTNLWNFRGLYVSNIRPSEETKQILRDILSDFGKVTLVDLIPDKETAIINFDNPESPRIAMSELQGVHMPNICVHNQRLRIRFRPLNDSKNYPSINCATDRKLNNECYFWRTTGCNYTNFCKLKHIPANKGVDFQPWMQTIKSRFKRQHRNRFEVV